MIVRNVKKEDLRAVSEIAVRGWQTAYRGIIDDEYLDSLSIEENYQKRLKDYKENGFIVAELDSEVVGFCRYTLENLFSKDIPDIDGEICAIYVKPEFIKDNPLQENQFEPMTLNGITYPEKAGAGQALLNVCQKKTNADLEYIGNYRGFDMELEYNRFDKLFKLRLKREYSYDVELGNDIHGNIQRIDNCLSKIEEMIEPTKNQLENIKQQVKIAEIEVKKEFPQENILEQKQTRLNELNAKLNINENEHEIFEDEKEENQEKSLDKNSPERC